MPTPGSTSGTPSCRTSSPAGTTSSRRCTELPARADTTISSPPDGDTTRQRRRMKPALRHLAATTAGALTIALTVGTAGPAAAQDIDVSSLGEQGVGSALEVIGSLP